MLSLEDLLELPESNLTISRAKIRFAGIGPRISEENNTASETRIWPRDSLKWKRQSNMVLYDGLKQKINNDQICDRIREIVRLTFERLANCNVNQVFNRFCPLDSGHFDKVSFAIHTALDCYTTYKQVLAFVHQVFRSLNTGKRDSSNLIKKIFGCNRNFNVFKIHLTELISAGERLDEINIVHFVSCDPLNMDLCEVTWLEGLEQDVKYRVYIQFIFSLVRFILDLLRRYFHITCGNHTADKLFYYRYDLWQKIQDYNIQDLIGLGVFAPLDCDIGEINSVSESKLRFHLKKDGLRPICIKSKCTEETRTLNLHLCAVLKAILKKWTGHETFTLNNLLAGLRSFKKRMVDNNAQIYIVRADIKDCFQSVDQDLLRKTVLSKAAALVSADGKLLLKKVICLAKRRRRKRGTERPYHLWTLDYEAERSRQRYEHVHELDHPVRLSLDDFDKIYLQHHIINPIVRGTRRSKKKFILIKGLRQGSAYSPLFCSIYIQAAFDQYIGEFLASESCQVFRYVDDILFISTDLDESKKFMHKMLRGFKDFNLGMNIDKLSCNFTCPGLDEGLCRLHEYVVFYKLRIELETLRCTHHYVFNDIPLQYTFKVDPYVNRDQMLRYIRAVRINIIHMDIQLNGIDQVVENIFEEALLLAHRSGVSVLKSFAMVAIANQQPTFVADLARLSGEKIFLAISAGVRKKVIENYFERDEINLIVSTAFMATWGRIHLKHRKWELRELEKLQKNCFKQVRLARNEGEQVPEFWQQKIGQLLTDFPRCSFVREAVLPHRHHKFK